MFSANFSDSSTNHTTVDFAAMASNAIIECKPQPKQAVVTMISDSGTGNTNPAREKEKDTSEQDARSNNQSDTMDIDNDNVNIAAADKREPTNTDANKSQPKRKRNTETNFATNGKDEISNNQSDKMDHDGDDVMIVETGKGEPVNIESEPKKEKRKKIPKKAGSGAKPKEPTTVNDDKASEVSTQVSTPNKKRKKQTKTKRTRPALSKTAEVKIARGVSELLKGYSNSPEFKGGLKEVVEKVIHDEVKSQQQAQSKESKETEAKLRLKLKAATNEGTDSKSTIKLLNARNDSERKLSDDSAKKITQLQAEIGALIAQKAELYKQLHPQQPAPAEDGASGSESSDSEASSDSE